MELGKIAEISFRIIFISITMILLETNISCASFQGIRYGDVRINEIYPDNEPYEWVELINMTGKEVVIKDYYLSDGDNLYKIEENITIQPHQKLAITAPGADGKWPEYDSQEASDKTWGFKKSKQEAAILLGPQGQKAVDFILPPSPRQNLKYQSFGRYPDGSDSLHVFSKETQNGSNDEGEEYYTPPKPSFTDSLKDLLETSIGKILALVGFLGNIAAVLGLYSIFRSYHRKIFAKK
jgi:hypothetical protein